MIRVIQCGTGTAGAQALKAIIANPALELAGLLVTAPGKVGRDAGELCGMAAAGVPATDDFDAIVATDADCVCYMLLVPDLDQICALLASGKNVVTTAGLLFPRRENPGAARRLREACERGNSSFYASGINPGWVDEILPLTMSGLSRRLEQVIIREYADCARYPAPHIIELMGFGKTLDDVEQGRVQDMEVMCTFFRQTIEALAHGLGLALDEVTESREFALTDRGYDIAAGHIPAGTIAGQRWRWTGVAGGRERIVQETYWFTAFGLGEGYPDEGDLEDDTLWEVVLEGDPSFRCRFEPRHSFAGNAAQKDYNPSGLATAMAAVNAIEPVCAARPGLLTAADLPLLHGRHLWEATSSGDGRGTIAD